MSDTREEVEESESLVMEEGDVSVVIRADGQVEFMIFSEDDTSDEYAHSMHMVEYLKFVLDNPACIEIFEKARVKILN